MSEIIGYNDRVILDQYGASIGGGDGSRSSRPTCSANRTLQFRKELETLINCHSRENGSDTPDFILADYLTDCLTAFDKAVTNRAYWYGHKTHPVPAPDSPNVQDHQSQPKQKHTNMKTTIEIEVEVEYTYNKGDPGYMSGPPERCYPPEPESAEIISVSLNGFDIYEALTTKQIESLAEQCCEEARNEIADRDIP